MCQIIRSIGVNVHYAAAFNSIDYRTRKFGGKGGTTETPAQASAAGYYRGVGVCGSVDYDGTLAGTVVYPLLQSVQDKRVAVLALIGRLGEIKS